ncbi:hypothetical protein [Actinomadura sediminis]|uniref:Uncharacterized protein n=1 Tax=Actinomadura sediminis TaxID=1038904 RepID=A0ABW3EZM6_9ACTN
MVIVLTGGYTPWPVEAPPGRPAAALVGAEPPAPPGRIETVRLGPSPGSPT